MVYKSYELRFLVLDFIFSASRLGFQTIVFRFGMQVWLSSEEASNLEDGSCETKTSLENPSRYTFLKTEKIAFVKLEYKMRVLRNSLKSNNNATIRHTSSLRSLLSKALSQNTHLRHNPSVIHLRSMQPRSTFSAATLIFPACVARQLLGNA